MTAQEAQNQMVNVIRRKHLALQTEHSYCGWLRRYMVFLQAENHVGSHAEKLERFLVVLAKDGVAASTQNQAFNAIRFFYVEVMKIDLGNVNALRAKAPAHVRTAPDRPATERFLSLVKDIHGYPARLVVFLLYGMGLRLTEPLSLRIKDISIPESTIIIRDAKGGKDRARSIPCCLMPAIKRQIQRSQMIFEQARAEGVPTKLPGGLGKKYPAAEHSFGWFWLFPAKFSCRDARDNGRRVWWHMHEANVQKACKVAAGQMGMSGIITPHVLRHAWATHALQSGANIKAIQSALGHVCLDTTAGYLHDSTAVPSPLDTLMSSLPDVFCLPQCRPVA